MDSHDDVFHSYLVIFQSDSRGSLVIYLFFIIMEINSQIFTAGAAIPA